ncbi:hypothetical protein [Desulforhopalus singaporensis]|uniref:hypothetical protein n=1 Tax=Desulforhopalus singaporensis TaxID=91360 RepID=UPI00115FA5FF|nr:hypothetical protein [Desulforhopalus singaporensis]
MIVHGCRARAYAFLVGFCGVTLQYCGAITGGVHGNIHSFHNYKWQLGWLVDYREANIELSWNVACKHPLHFFPSCRKASAHLEFSFLDNDRLIAASPPSQNQYQFQADKALLIEI